MRRFHRYSGDDFQGECPTGTGRFVTVAAVADEIGGRLTKIFLRGSKGLRPVFGQDDKLQADPNFQDHLLFYEDFHGETGRGVGASHQTGWTGLIAALIHDGTTPLRS